MPISAVDTITLAFQPTKRTSSLDRDYYIAKLDELVKKFADVTGAPQQEALLL